MNRKNNNVLLGRVMAQMFTRGGGIGGGKEETVDCCCCWLKFV